MLAFLISKEIRNGWKLLDIGCGRNSPLKNIRKNCYKIGLDIYKPYIVDSRKAEIHNDYICGAVTALPFKSKTFDCLIATEVLEHLNKEASLEMLKEIERVARNKIILTTPNGFLATYAGPKDNPEEKHLSGYIYNELRDLGFRVYGIGGYRKFWTISRGQAVTKFRLPILSALLIGISEFFVYQRPQAAFQFFLVKNLK